MKGKYPNGLADVLGVRPNVTQAQLADAAGTSPQQINRLLQGERELTAGWAEKLAPTLRTTPEELVFPGLKTVRAPLLSWESAARLACGGELAKADVRKYVQCADVPRGDWIVLEVAGDDMNRVALPGARICVNLADQRLVDDKFYVFATKDGSAMFRQFRAPPARLQPFSTNLDHLAIGMGSDTLVLGRVGQVITDLN
jgi:phage repressor protein C with HTH and peptisase S24 domain